MVWADNERVLMAWAGSHDCPSGAAKHLQHTLLLGAGVGTTMSHSLASDVRATMLRVSKNNVLKHTVTVQQLLAAFNAQMNTIAANYQTDHVTIHPCRVVGTTAVEQGWSDSSSAAETALLRPRTHGAC